MAQFCTVCGDEDGGSEGGVVERAVREDVARAVEQVWAVGVVHELLIVRQRADKVLDPIRHLEERFQVGGRIAEEALEELHNEANRNAQVIIGAAGRDRAAQLRSRVK